MQCAQPDGGARHAGLRPGPLIREPGQETPPAADPCTNAPLMPNRDVFALDRAGFNGFLFAAIGTEADGSRLTVLSALARLGEDPWTKAAMWARMPKAASGEALAATIAQMPVTLEDQLAAAQTAARLVQLLPPTAATVSHLPGFSGPPPRPGWIMIMAIGVCTMIVLSSAFLLSHQHAGSQPSTAEAAGSQTP